MFEITPDDCARLDDKQLRDLVGLLCEAELRQRGLPVDGVTWGADQNAPDGGLDVRISLSPRTAVYEAAALLSTLWLESMIKLYYCGNPRLARWLDAIPHHARLDALRLMPSPTD